MAKIKWIDERLTSDMLKVLETIQTQMTKGEAWEMPWQKMSVNGIPVNGVKGTAYNGMNALTLGMAGMPSNKFATEKDWAKGGREVRQEEITARRGFPVIWFNFVPTKDDPKKTYPVLKWSFVFNESQLTDYEPEAPKEAPCLVERDTFVDTFIENTGMKVVFGGDRAFFAPGPDHVGMPLPETFQDTDNSSASENFYSTFLHEGIHWTGHDSRLKRDFGGSFGSKLYAFEELVAELGSALACAKLGVSSHTRPDHAAYIGSWIKGLKDDPTALRRAATLAQKAFKYLEDLQPKTE